MLLNTLYVEHIAEKRSWLPCEPGGFLARSADPAGLMTRPAGWVGLLEGTLKSCRRDASTKFKPARAHLTPKQLFAVPTSPGSGRGHRNDGHIIDREVVMMVRGGKSYVSFHSTFCRNTEFVIPKVPVTIMLATVDFISFSIDYLI